MFKMSIGQIVIAAIVQIGFIILTALYFLRPDVIPVELKDQAALITGAWITNFTTIVNWNFGSSKGSADKNSLLAGKNNPNN